MKKRLDALEIAVVVFGSSLMASLWALLNTPTNNRFGIAYGSMTIIFLTLFIIVSFIKLKNMISKAKNDGG